MHIMVCLIKVVILISCSLHHVCTDLNAFQQTNESFCLLSCRQTFHLDLCFASLVLEATAVPVRNTE